MPQPSSFPAAKTVPGIFREYDIRGTVGKTLFEADAAHIGRAFATTIGETYHSRRICVAYDGRLSSPAMVKALVEGLSECGAHVIQLGLGPTPMLYYGVYSQKADGGIMVTGSHNPPDHNGFKFMFGTGPFYGADIQKLYQRIASGGYTPGKGSVREENIVAEYIARMRRDYNGSKKLRIAWDPGNGATGEVITALCRDLPGEHIVINAKIDGNFPSHHPDPTVPENLRQLIDTVKKEKCDIGIAFDGDGDRIGAVDDTGEIIFGDQLLMLFAREVLAEMPGATVIADVKASEALFDEVRKLGGEALMWKTGHSLIKAKMAQTRAPLAGEMSGHIFFADRYYGFDDAVYAAVRLAGLVSRLDEPLSAVRNAFPKLHNTPEIRFACDEKRKFEVITEVASRLRAEGAQFSDIDGVRVRRPDGWWLLRASNTQAVLVARCESTTSKGLENLKAELKQQLDKSQVALAA
jgi:phosphomannomutase